MLTQKKISDPTIFFGPKVFFNPNLFSSKKMSTQKKVHLNFFQPTKFFGNTKFPLRKKWLPEIFVGLKKCWWKKVGQKHKTFKKIGWTERARAPPLQPLAAARRTADFLVIFQDSSSNLKTFLINMRATKLHKIYSLTLKGVVNKFHIFCPWLM